MDGQWLDTGWMVAQIGLAALLGGLIGLEREFAGKPAGLRTHMLIAAAAALLMKLGMLLVKEFEPFGRGPIPFVQFDPLRIIEAVITGISFLGAGMIIFRRERHQVEGLTTAASALLVAGVGIAVGLGTYALAVSVTVLILVILLALGWVERRLEPWRRTRRDKIDRETNERGDG